jgi:hypothetical protein
MARMRQARRCRAHHADETPCKGWAIEGGTVCMAHGGATPQAQAAAESRLVAASLERAADATIARWSRALREWQVKQVSETAELLSLSPAEVTPVLIGVCRGLYGRPDPPESAPQLIDFWDRRFTRGITKPGGLPLEPRPHGHSTVDTVS